MSDRQKQHFRFMDLPAELRMMVYEFLPLQQQPFKISTGVGDGAPTDEDDIAMTLVRHSVSLQIIRVCKTIHREAQAIMKEKALEILIVAIAIIVEARDINGKSTRSGILKYASQWFSALQEDNTLQFDNWSTRANFSNLPLLALWRRPVRLFVWQTGLQLLRQRQERMSSEIRPRPSTIQRLRMGHEAMLDRLRPYLSADINCNYECSLSPRDQSYQHHCHKMAQELESIFDFSWPFVESLRHTSLAIKYKAGSADFTHVWNVNEEFEDIPRIQTIYDHTWYFN